MSSPTATSADSSARSRRVSSARIGHPAQTPRHHVYGYSASFTTGSVLSQPLLTRCRERAASYDRDNRFFQEDFDELKAAGYLRMAIPREFGGFGMNLFEVGRETRTLAVRAGHRSSS